MFHTIAKSFEHCMDTVTAEPFREFVRQCLPQLTGYFTAISAQSPVSPEGAFALKLMCKIVWRVAQSNGAVVFDGDRAVLFGWCQAFLQALGIAVPQGHAQLWKVEIACMCFWGCGRGFKGV